LYLTGREIAHGPEDDAAAEEVRIDTPAEMTL